MKSFHRATTALRRMLPESVSLERGDCIRASCDASKLTFLPEAVVTVRRADEIRKLLRCANLHGVPVTVRGGGTSLTGSASPRHGGWVIDVSRLNKVRIDAENGMAFAQAGAIVARIQEKAEEKGWAYPPDPASRAFCTIGGTVACNAGGMRGLAHGVTRDYVLALYGYLPNGEFVRWGRPLFKHSAGYNLRDLWIGSEGTLGVVTEVVLRLVPAAKARFTLVAEFPDEAAAFSAGRELLSLRVRPAICEYMDAICVRCASAGDLSGRAATCPTILVELAGDRGEIKQRSRVLTKWASRRALRWRKACSRRESENLWALRRSVSGALFKLAPSKLNQDVVLPRASYVRFSRLVRRLAARSGLNLAVFGHLGDGNLHVNVMYDGRRDQERRRAEHVVSQLMKATVSMGGAISGEHGIGLTKSAYFGLEHREAEIAAMKTVKNALDPQGILNPGKLFKPTNVARLPRLDTRLPWDAA